MLYTLSHLVLKIALQIVLTVQMTNDVETLWPATTIHVIDGKTGIQTRSIWCPWHKSRTSNYKLGLLAIYWGLPTEGYESFPTEGQIVLDIVSGHITSYRKETHVIPQAPACAQAIPCAHFLFSALQEFITPLKTWLNSPNWVRQS